MGATAATTPVNGSSSRKEALVVDEEASRGATVVNNENKGSEECSPASSRSSSTSLPLGLIGNDKNNNFVLGEEFVQKIMKHSTEETKNFITNLIENNKNNINMNDYATVTHKQISEVCY